MQTCSFSFGVYLILIVFYLYCPSATVFLFSPHLIVNLISLTHISTPLLPLSGLSLCLTWSLSCWRVSQDTGGGWAMVSEMHRSAPPLPLRPVAWQLPTGSVTAATMISPPSSSAARAALRPLTPPASPRSPSHPIPDRRLLWVPG